MKHEKEFEKWVQQIGKIEGEDDPFLSMMHNDCRASDLEDLAKSAWSACEEMYEDRIKNLIKVIGYYASQDNWYSKDGSPKCEHIDSIDTEGDNGVGGKMARKTLIDLGYSGYDEMFKK